MTSRDDEPIGPALRVVARSTTEGIRVEWHDTLGPGELADACDGLADFLVSSTLRRLAAGAGASLPAGHPHEGELQQPSHTDEHRFCDIVVTRHGPSGWYVEPSAADRARGAEVADGPATSVTPQGTPYAPSRFAFGPGGPAAGDGPALPLAAFAAAIRAELDRRRP